MQGKVASISALRDSIVSAGNLPPEYVDKMIHRIPDIPVVKDRAAYLVEKSKEKIVLDIGCTGDISKLIRKSAKKYYGIDKEDGDCIVGCDIDHRPDLMPVFDDVEIIICSEVLEHLANPGYFLLALKDKYPGRIVYITVPNAGAYTVRDSHEIVNREHVCWYSWQTLKTLVTRYGYEIQESRWYNGQPFKAEGIIMVVRT